MKYLFFNFIFRILAKLLFIKKLSFKDTITTFFEEFWYLILSND